jgi:hemoglobin
MDRALIGDETAFGIAWSWSGYGSQRLALDRFVATGQIDQQVTDEVDASLRTLRSALALETPPVPSAAAAVSVSVAQLTVLLAYLQAHGPRGPQAGWRALPPVDWRDVTDPFGNSHDPKEGKGHMTATPADYVYQRLGGPERGPANVAAVVDRLYELILNDPELAGYFRGIDMRRLKAHMRAFIVAAVGGPDHYQGRSLGAAHSHLRISDEHFSRVVSHLVRALSEFHVAPDVVEEIAAKLAPLRPQIVRADHSDG